MNLRSIKKELFYVRKAFLQYHAGFKYLYNKYILAPKILKSKKIFEKPVNNNDLSIHILTCHKDLIMTLWSLVSFYHFSKVIGKLYVHNDGSLTDKDKAVLNRFFPNVIILDTENFLKIYDGELSSWPVIKRFRSNEKYLLLKKLVDQYFISKADRRLVIDSDLLWLKNPTDIEEVAISESDKSLVMENSAACKVYFQQGELDESLARVNSGVVLYHKSNFNLKKLEEYLNNINVNDPRNIHFIEQAGYASCLEDLNFLSVNHYVIKGKVDDSTIVKHYTSPRRPLFYIEGVPKLKKIILN